LVPEGLVGCGLVEKEVKKKKKIKNPTKKTKKKKKRIKVRWVKKKEIGRLKGGLVWGWWEYKYLPSFPLSSSWSPLFVMSFGLVNQWRSLGIPNRVAWIKILVFFYRCLLWLSLSLWSVSIFNSADKKRVFF